MGHSNKISDLSANHQRTVHRLWNEKPVSVDAITGLFQTIENKFYRQHPELIGHASDWSKPTNQINYAPLPGKLKPYPDPRELLNESTQAVDIHVERGTRLKGTRAGIHVHESGGITFVMRGKGGITDFVDGLTNSFNPGGHYYYMPANTIMSAANFSSGNLKLMDLFITPSGQPMITVLEPGYPGYTPS